MIHLVTGGSGSGKSAYAEQCILDFGGTRRVYIATMQPFGAEGQARIARHRKMRAAKKFSTIECYTNLKEVELEPGSDVLLECMSNLTANETFDPSGPSGTHRRGYGAALPSGAGRHRAADRRAYRTA